MLSGLEVLCLKLFIDRGLAVECKITILETITCYFLLREPLAENKSV